MKKKIVYSFLLFGASLLTMAATTYAWVGITTSSTFDEVSLQLKTDNDSGDYGVQLSLTGLPNSFSDSLDATSVKRQLLKNIGYSNTEAMSDDTVNVTYAKQSLEQCTPRKNSTDPEIFSGEAKQVFENVMTGYSTSKYLWLDVYATMYVAKVGASSDIPLSLFLRESILSSEDIGSTILMNSYSYPATPYALNGLNFPQSFLGKYMAGSIRVNPASAARVCIQSFEPIDLYTMWNTDLIDYKIYQYDSVMPSYDSVNDVYSFGGILPSDYNMAYQQYHMAHIDSYLGEVPEYQINRGDITYEDSGYTGCVAYNGSDGYRNDNFTIGKMMKFRIYFWFEGWDSDCFEVIDKKTVTVNLSFSNKAPFDV